MGNGCASGIGRVLPRVWVAMCYVRECLDFCGDISRCPARRQERTAACGESSTSSEAASSCPQVKPSCYVTGFLLVQITVYAHHQSWSEGEKSGRLPFVSRVVDLLSFSCTLAGPVSRSVQALHIPCFAFNCLSTDGLLQPGCFGPRRLGALWLGDTVLMGEEGW